MRVLWRKFSLLAIALSSYATAANAGAPPQKLPSALLVFPLIQADGNRDTRIELLNLSGDPQEVNCFYVDGDSCNEIGFIISLTPYQPVAWFAGGGVNNVSSGSAAPPFFGEGELKCVVVPPHPETEFHNTIQGRATVFGLDGQTVAYGAVGFQRLIAGDFTGTVSLDGTTYTQCPDRLHFDALTEQSGSVSEMVLAPCSQDLLLQTIPSIVVQFQIINEFEQSFSTSITVTCFTHSTLDEISDAFSRATAGTDTIHVVLRGSTGPLLGLMIDQVPFGGMSGSAGNEPAFQGGRSATVVFP